MASENDRLEALFKSQPDFWRTALVGVGDGLIIADSALRVTFINPAAERLCGRIEDEAVHAQLGDVVRLTRDGNSEYTNSIMARAIECGTPQAIERHTVLRGTGGDDAPVGGSLYPIKDEAGHTVGVVIVLRDITERQQAEELRERLAAVVESSDDVVISKDLNGIITGWNSGAERVLGYTADEVIGKHVSMLMPEGHQEDTAKILSRISKGEKVDHYETKRRRKDGTIIDVSLTVSPIRNSYGEIIGASKVGRDITERRGHEELRERLAAIVESSDDMIVSKTLEGIITSWNRGAEKLLGYSAEEMVGRHVSCIMPPDQPEDYEKILSKVRTGESIDHYETRRRRKDGTIVDVSLTVSPLRNADGVIIGASKIGRDITQQKLIEAERREADRRKDEFLAMLAHELRNPLASINNAVQLFGRLESEDELLWAKDVVRRHVQHLARLIDDLLDVSRITRGKIVLKTEVIDLAPVVTSSVEAVRHLMEDRKHELMVSIGAGSLRLEADPLRLEQVLVNLLSNAAKYTNDGGKIYLTCRRDGDHLAISVKDNGVGISPELLSRMFDIFVQGDRTIARSEGGLGIGLTLVQKLTEMHDGSVTAVSEGPGKGSEFTVRLPAAAPADAPRTAPMLAPISAARKCTRVLVVDDNVDMADGLSKLLTLLGHDVKTAYDGLQALEMAKALGPEVILLDLGLPGVDGYEVARQLREHECCRNSLMIAISGYGQEEDKRKSKECGFDHHLTKPVDYKALIAVLHERE